MRHEGGKAYLQGRRWLFCHHNGTPDEGRERGEEKEKTVRSREKLWHMLVANSGKVNSTVQSKYSQLFASTSIDPLMLVYVLRSISCAKTNLILVVSFEKFSREEFEVITPVSFSV